MKRKERKGKLFVIVILKNKKGFNGYIMKNKTKAN